jgi:hypothetical protein
MIIGTILLLLILFPQEQQVDAGQTQDEPTTEGMTQSALSQLKSVLSNSESPDVQKNIENKIQALEYKQQVQAQAQQEPQKSLEEVCKSIAVQNMSTAKQMDEQPQGIFDLEEGFLGDRGYRTNNMWRGEYSGYETEVYAGSLLSDPQQGILVVNIPTLSFLKVFLDPNPSGALTITEVNGHQFQMATAAGSLSNFSLPAQQFTNDLSKSMSVVDLPPLPTPIHDPCAEFITP